MALLNDAQLSSLTTPTAPGVKPSLQDAVRQLQTQYAQTGMVRGGDVNRVLGNPTEGVEIALRSDVSGSVWKTV